MAEQISAEAKEVLRLLRSNHNVLIVGPPGTGKSRLLNELRAAFKQKGGAVPHHPGAAVPIPDEPDPGDDWMPSPDRDDREVFQAVFNQNFKYRDFLRALEPRVDPTSGGTTFRISEGIMYRASEHAKQPDGASLLMIDEINRGPAVQIFGPAITPVESDKRLLDDGTEGPNTSYFDLPDDDGDPTPYALPHQLYLVAAMNEADTSVEALDVAFLRRWVRFTLAPQVDVLAEYLGVSDLDAELPEEPSSHEDVYRALIRAWRAVNDRIAVGQGTAYQIGHGIFMREAAPDTSVQAAERFARAGWRALRAHVNEVFFGSPEKIAAALNVQNVPDHPYKLETQLFAGSPVATLDDSAGDQGDVLYAVLRAVAADVD